jgi:hypothetical protein
MSVMLAQAGIQYQSSSLYRVLALDFRLRGNDERQDQSWYETVPYNRAPARG